MNQAEQMLPCPFCGGVDIPHTDHGRIGVGQHRNERVWSMCCYSCGASVPNRYGEHGRKLMVEGWNKRALPLPEPTPDKRDEALENARSLLSACLQDYGHPYFTDRSGMADRIRPALAAIEAALSTDAPKPDTRRSEEEVRAEIAFLKAGIQECSETISGYDHRRVIRYRIAALEWVLAGDKPVRARLLLRG